MPPARIGCSHSLDQVTDLTIETRGLPGLLDLKFQKMLESYGMVGSMSRKGDCWDSVTESSFGSLKTERVYDSTYSNREEVHLDIVDYIEMFYNSRRRYSYLGYRSPREFEKMMTLKKAA